MLVNRCAALISQSNILKWDLAHAALMLGLCLVAILSRQSLWIVFGASVSFTIFCWLGRESLNPNGAFFVGFANGLTLMRFLAVSVIGWLYPTEYPYLVGLALLACVCLDGVDGYLARKYGEETVFGQYLDMETDAYAIYMMALLLWLYHEVSIVVLVAGTLRYSYSWAIKLIFHQPRIEPKRKYASIVAVLFYLAMNLNFIITNTFTRSLVYALMLILLLSFARSFWFQWRSFAMEVRE